MNSNEQRIREFAYQIWQSEGKPHGQAKRHWEMACKLAESDVQQSTSTTSPKAKAPSKKSLPTGEIPAAAKPAKNPKTTTTTSPAAAVKADAAKKAKAKPADAKVKATETKVKTAEKTETKKPAAVKKSKISESQPI